MGILEHVENMRQTQNLVSLLQMLNAEAVKGWADDVMQDSLPAIDFSTLTPEEAKAIVIMLDMAELSLFSLQQKPETIALIPENLFRAIKKIYDFLSPYSGLLRKIAEGKATVEEIEHANLKKNLMYHTRQRRLKNAA